MEQERLNYGERRSGPKGGRLLAGRQGDLGSIEQLHDGRQQQVQIVVQVGAEQLDGSQQLQEGEEGW